MTGKLIGLLKQYRDFALLAAAMLLLLAAAAASQGGGWLGLLECWLYVVSWS